MNRQQWIEYLRPLVQQDWKRFWRELRQAEREVGPLVAELELPAVEHPHELARAGAE